MASNRAPGPGLGTFLLLSALVHGLVVFAVGLSWDPPEPRPSPPMLDLTLVTTPQPAPVEDAERIAAEDQAGGGERTSPDAARGIPAPGRPLPAPAEPVPVSPPLEQPQQPSALDEPPQPAPEDPAPAAADTSADTSPERPGEAEPEVVRAREATATPADRGGEEPAAAEPDEPAVEAGQLLASSRELVSRGAFGEDDRPAESEFPDRRRITARTREHAAAEYMRGWIDKVERVGNLNYPAEARQRGLSGRLILEVILRPDGSVVDTRLLEPSPHSLLDAAALRIVDLAAPFAPVPDAVLQGSEQLVITRTWEFRQGQRFRADR
ncbi:TonB family protein [Arhodomonas sp. SL1]|uniref:energy transducer TonB n=1 Tax=Arhodomonas sp. SL1 TaxID=3425691 RepID=UPI003F881AB4